MCVKPTADQTWDIFWDTLYRVGQIKQGQCSFFRRSKSIREF